MLLLSLHRVIRKWVTAWQPILFERGFNRSFSQIAVAHYRSEYIWCIKHRSIVWPPKSVATTGFSDNPIFTRIGMAHPLGAAYERTEFGSSSRPPLRSQPGGKTRSILLASGVSLGGLMRNTDRRPQSLYQSGYQKTASIPRRLDIPFIYRAE